MRHAAATLALTLLALSACTPFPDLQRAAPTVWEFDPALPSARARTPLPALAVAPPTAIPALATPEMAYREQRFERRYYADNRWVDTPARLLHDHLVTALETTGVAGTIVRADARTTAAYRLETELRELEHDYRDRPEGRTRIALRARLVATEDDAILAERTFEATADSRARGPAGGVAAGNRALEAVLRELVHWLAETALDE